MLYNINIYIIFNKIEIKVNKKEEYKSKKNRIKNVFNHL